MMNYHTPPISEEACLGTFCAQSKQRTVLERMFENAKTLSSYNADYRKEYRMMSITSSHVFFNLAYTVMKSSTD